MEYFELRLLFSTTTTKGQKLKLVEQIIIFPSLMTYYRAIGTCYSRLFPINTFNSRIFFNGVTHFSTIDKDTPKSKNIVWSEGIVKRTARHELLQQRGGTVWLTGLSGSGKSAIAALVERKLIDRGILAYRLDGDNIRFGLNRNLGFSEEDREENIRRVAEVHLIILPSSHLDAYLFIFR